MLCREVGSRTLAPQSATCISILTRLSPKNREFETCSARYPVDFGVSVLRYEDSSFEPGLYWLTADLVSADTVRANKKPRAVLPGGAVLTREPKFRILNCLAPRSGLEPTAQWLALARPIGLRVPEPQARCLRNQQQHRLSATTTADPPGEPAGPTRETEFGQSEEYHMV